MVRKKIYRKLRATLYVMPAFVLHFAVITVPALSILYLAFTKWSGLDVPQFNGLENFRRMIFEDTDFHEALLHNLVWMFIFLTIPIVMGLLIAMSIIKVRRSQVVYRTVFFLPYVISPVIASKIFFIYYSPYIGINTIFERLGLHFLATISWVGPDLALYSIAFVNFWRWWGFVTILLVAALHQVDVDLYEAASIEGANSFQRFWHVTLPQIMPTLITLMMITIIGSFLTFDYIWVMTQGGPAGATEVASTWIYKRAFDSFEAGYGSTMSLFISGVCLFFYFGFRVLQKKGWDI